MLPSQELGGWANILPWLISNKEQFSYAAIASIFSLIRTSYYTNSWCKRLLDAISCGSLAFFSTPLLEVFARFFHIELPEQSPTVAAIFIGYVGNDYIYGFVSRRLNNLREREQGDL